ncbi:hypothetical protein LZ32DRAFT_609631 [Colletotrichum eremochloae]|nr:hypothetical protein LZ32DRAFT_609631 [Colletotrichum eremochloae]
MPSARLRSLLRFYLSLSFSTTSIGQKCSTFVDFVLAVTERRGRTRTQKRKKKKEGVICFEKKGASQTGKASILPNDTERTTKRQTLDQHRPASGKTANSVSLEGWEREKEEANHGTRLIVRRCYGTLTANA